MSRVIKVDYLARVEGEGSLFIELEDGRVSGVEVGIFEPPRFFEAFLRGRKYYEVPDITARICGICPIAYIMSSSRALEKILGIEVPEEIEKLR
ncbi:MAG: nickel-dependent hydrogenase large subunit, partial [Zestosphaera sp.]